MILKNENMEVQHCEWEIPVSNEASPLSENGLINSVRKKLLAKFSNARGGQVEVFDGGDRFKFGQLQANHDLSVKIKVADRQFYKTILFGGTIGSAEAYIAEHWACSDLTGLIRIMIRNMDSVSRMDKAVSRFRTLAYKVSHSLRRNTKQGSRKNIQEHYDLGNDFYECFLDPTMNYSSGIFDAVERDAKFSNTEDELHAASMSKMDRICRKLKLNPEQHVLEIGTGWGAMAVHMAKHYGCRVTTTTISEEQYSVAVDRVKEEGLEDHVTVLKKDYRDLEGQFDKIVSIEMVEAVGRKFMNTFFGKCSSLLQSNGDMLLQAITMSEQNYQSYIKSVDFIRAYVFPGGCLPSVTSLGNAAATATDMRVLDLEDMTPHYAKTLECWKIRFLANIDRVRELGYDEKLIRLWHFYLSYCEAAFLERRVHCVQTIFSKPESSLDLATASTVKGEGSADGASNYGCLI